MNELIKNAMTFANQRHNVQTYDNCFPYFKHLEDVYNTLLRFNFNEKDDLDLLISAWLHDTIEDTNTSYSDIKKEFGENIAEIVFCVTDELGRNRTERKIKTYPKIRSNPKSVILKVADRISNVKFGLENKSNQYLMYQKEQKDFEYNLRIYKQIDDMWNELNKLLLTNLEK